jgi:hypothetical protein
MENAAGKPQMHDVAWVSLQVGEEWYGRQNVYG